MYTYIKTEDYEMTLEKQGGEFFVHCDVWSFSPSVMKNLKYNFYGLLETFLDSEIDFLYAYLPSTRKNVKFCKSLFPCDVVSEVDVEGETYAIVEWDIMKGLSWDL